MIGKSQIRDSDLVFVVGGDAWTSAGNDPILGRLFAGHALPEPRRPKASSRVVFVAVCGLALVWCAWPYYAVHRLFNAIRHADVAELENRVAWQDLRQSLRGDLNAIFFAIRAGEEQLPRGLG